MEKEVSLWKIITCLVRPHHWSEEEHHKQGFSSRRCTRCGMVQHRHWGGTDEWFEKLDGRYARLSFALSITVMVALAGWVLRGVL